MGKIEENHGTCRYRFWFISQSRMYPTCGNYNWFMIDWLNVSLTSLTFGFMVYISNNLNDYWVFKVSGCSRYIVWCVLGFASHAYFCKGVVIVDLPDPGSKTWKVTPPAPSWEMGASWIDQNPWDPRWMLVRLYLNNIGEWYWLFYVFFITCVYLICVSWYFHIVWLILLIVFPAKGGI